MEIYTDTTKVTLMPDATIAPITTTMTVQAAPVIVEARGRVHTPGTSLRPIEGSAFAGGASGSLPVFPCTTDLGSTAWGPPL